MHVQNCFWGGWQTVSLVFKPPSLPPSPQKVISDTSCHTPYMFFKNTNCVTPPQIIFANLRRFPQNFDFQKTLACSNCKTKRHFCKFFQTDDLADFLRYFFLYRQKLKDGKWRTVPKNKEFWRELVCIVVQIVNEPVNSL